MHLNSSPIFGAITRPFPLFLLSVLVNAKRIEKKIPNLLVAGSTTKKPNYNKFRRIEYSNDEVT
jgi:hypothetical protein